MELRYRPLVGSLLVAPLVLLGNPSQAAGQGGQQGSTSCTLRWRSLTESTASRSIEIGPDRYRHHVWNGMRWTCGGAVMTADSAVQYPGQRVEMVGAVHYRDSIRTLDSRRLTYYQTSDLIEAREAVRLVRRATGSTLRAPSVDFYRAGSGEIRQTVATGGSRMEVYPPGDSAEEPRQPFHVTSDTTIILQEDLILARGDVVVTRQETEGTGAFGRFDMEAGEGMLTGDPVLTGEDYRLTGDTVWTVTDDGDLREVRAAGSGHLESEGLDVRAPRIRVAVRDQTVRSLWAFGGDAASRSASRVMLGDSLRFDFLDGRPDSAAAVGEAAAVELAAGDTLTLQALLEAPGRTDTAAAPATDTAAEAPSDTLGGAPATTDTAARGPEQSPDQASSVGAGRSGLFGLERDWIRGDTVRAFFTARDTGTSGAAGVAPDAAGRSRDVALRELRAIGEARAYYRVTRDTVRDRRGRNYLMGNRVTITFRDGDPYRVLGMQAIGVYLEPAAAGQGSAPGPLTAPDTSSTPEATPDTLPRTLPDSVPPDTSSSRSDTTSTGMP